MYTRHACRCRLLVLLSGLALIGCDGTQSDRHEQLLRSELELERERRRSAELQAELAKAKQLLVRPSNDAASPTEIRAAASRPKARSDNALGMDLCWCPPGTFTMGSALNEAGRENNENQVEVRLAHGFWIGKTEVTQSEWRQLMRTEPWKGKFAVLEDDRCPATYVSWNECVEFCKRLTDSERQSGSLSSSEEYRLPTEAEWEYACRAGTTTPYSFGSNPAMLSDHAWFEDNANDTPRKVESKRANPWSLHDMHGNVWEFCSDWYSKELVGGTDPSGPSSGQYRVYRGGSWFVDATSCRSSLRVFCRPIDPNFQAGFRVVLIAPEQLGLR